MQSAEVGLGDREAGLDFGGLGLLVGGFEDGDASGELLERKVVLPETLGDERVQVEGGRVCGSLLAEPLEGEGGGVED